MSYPPPPGATNLPPRPPQPAAQSQPQRGGFQPAFGHTSAQPQRPSPQPYPTASTTSYSSQPTYSTPPANQHGQSYAPPSYGQTFGRGSSGGGSANYPSSMNNRSSSKPATTYSSYGQHQNQNYGAQSYGGGSGPPSAYSAQPHIQNPFPPPSTNEGYDAEQAAQIAQWQSAYTQRDPNAPTVTDEKDGRAVYDYSQEAAAQAAAQAEQQQQAQDGDRKKTVVREGGGKKWQDDSLTEWDPSHMRLFVGNLAGETTDDSLLKAFSRWGSVQKARVVRDKRSTKSKGYGFVAFSDADDFFKAAREMNGKYIQSHPVVVKKANTEIKVSNVRDDRRGRNNNKNKKNNDKKKRSGNGESGGGGGSGSYEPSLGPVGNNGVVKPGQKTKNGLKLLG